MASPLVDLLPLIKPAPAFLVLRHARGGWRCENGAETREAAERLCGALGCDIVVKRGVGSPTDRVYPGTEELAAWLYTQRA
jgi:hypothetical protein